MEKIMNASIAALEKLFHTAMHGRVRNLRISEIDGIPLSLNLGGNDRRGFLDELVNMADRLQDDFAAIKTREYDNGISDHKQIQEDKNEDLIYDIINDMFDAQTKLALRRAADHLTDRDPLKSYEDTEEYGRLLLRLSDAND